MNLFLDAETYYDKDYSLKDMPTAAYIRDPRFKVLGAAVSLGKGVQWMEPEPLSQFLAQVPWDKVNFVAHNTAFDGLILTDHYGYTPARFSCTMLILRYLIAQGELDSDQGTSLKDAAALVGMEKGDLDAALESGDLDAYAKLDGEILLALYKQYAHKVPEVERDYMDIHLRMACLPKFELDVPVLERLRDQDRKLEAIFPAVRKDDQFAALLEKCGVHPEYKTTPKGSYKLATAKTDAFMQRLHQHPKKIVRLLAEVRQKASSTIERTRADRFLSVGSPFPCPILYYGAHTGRGSGQDKLNVQNLKSDGDLRKSLCAPEGYRLIIVDSAQIEVRVNAWLSGQDDLLEEFRQGADPYVSFASSLYGVDADDISSLIQSAKQKEGRGGKLTSEEEEAKAQRQVAKAAVLALGFGQGANGFQAYCESRGITITPEEAKQTVDVYRNRYKNIRAHWTASEQDVRARGETLLPSDRKITYPDLRIGDEGLEYRRHRIFRKAKSEGHSNLWHGKIVENKVQALARDVVFYQTRRLWKQGFDIVLMAHDEAALMAREEDAETVLNKALVSFGSTPPWAPGLPVKGEGQIVERYTK